MSMGKNLYMTDLVHMLPRPSYENKYLLYYYSADPEIIGMEHGSLKRYIVYKWWI